MPKIPNFSKISKSLLSPGEYAKGAKKATSAVESDAERLARLSKTKPMIDKASAAQDREKLRELLENLAKDQPTESNKKRLQEFYQEYYGIKPSENLRSDLVEENLLKELDKAVEKNKKYLPKSEEITKTEILPSAKPEIRKSKRSLLKDDFSKEKDLDTFQYTLEARAKENPTPENIEILDNFRKKREAGEFPNLSTPLKAAGLAGALGIGSSLMSDEAEASPTTAAKKAALELYHATRGGFEGSKLKAGADRLIHLGTKEQAADRFAELSKAKKTASGAQTIPIEADIKNPLELSDLSDWSANKMFRDMKKRGVINEDQAQEIINRSRATKRQIGNDIDKDALLDYIQKDLGFDAIKYKNIYEASEADKIMAASKINPEMAKIPDLRAQKTSLESQLLDASGNPKPSSRETDKIHDQINKIDKQLRPLQNNLQSTFEKGAEYSYAVPQEHGGILKSKLSGTPLAIGGAAIGAGASASSLAQASEGPTISQSNPEFAGKQVETRETPKETSEEKSNLLKAIEAYGTAGRSALSSATLGISEPFMSTLNAGIGNLISAGFDAEDAVDFVKKAVDAERFKKEYQSDVDYRKQMQKEYPTADTAGSLAGMFSPVGPAAGAAHLLGKGTAKVGEALYKAGALKKLAGVVGEPAARSMIKTGLAAGEGAAFAPLISYPEEKFKELTGFAPEKNASENEDESDLLNQMLHGSTIQGGVKGGAQTFKLLKRLRR